MNRSQRRRWLRQVSRARVESLGARVLSALEASSSDADAGRAEAVLDTGDGIPGQVLVDAEYPTSMADS